MGGAGACGRLLHAHGGRAQARRPTLAELVGDLSIRDAQFRQWWAGTHVAVKRRGTRRYTHPVVGEITLEWDALTSDAEPDQQLVIYTAEPGSASDQALREPATWAAENTGASG